MSSRPPPPQGVPTLTEVVETSRLLGPVALDLSEPQFAAPTMVEAEVAPDADEPLDEAHLIERIHADLQRQVDLMLEYRLREVLGAVLARATDTLVRDARIELASTLRDVVARAVAQELSRHRGR